MKLPSYIKKQTGLTLIEMSIVLIISSILIGSGVSIALVQMENARISSTKEKQLAIKSALLSYISRNFRLPCPAIANLPDSNVNYGIEAANPGTCTGSTNIGGGANRNVRGIVPWKSLSLSDEISLDAYGHRFTYQVLQSQTNLTQSTLTQMRGNIALLNTRGGTQINALFPAVAIIISHGNNGRGSYMAISGNRMALPRNGNEPDERENTDNDVDFVKREFSNLAGNAFDDIIMTLDPTSILSTLSAQGDIASPNETLTEKISTLRSSLIGYIVADTTDPDGVGNRTVRRNLPFADGRANPIGTANGALTGFIPWQTIGLSAQDAVDPWGNVIRLSVDADITNAARGLTQSQPGQGTNAFTLSSDGIDGIQGNADDQVFSISAGTLVGSLPKITLDRDWLNGP